MFVFVAKWIFIHSFVCSEKTGSMPDLLGNAPVDSFAGNNF